MEIRFCHLDTKKSNTLCSSSNSLPKILTKVTSYYRELFDSYIKTLVVAITRDLGALVGTIELDALPSHSSSKTIKLGEEIFTIRASEPKQWDKSTAKWVGGKGLANVK
jgi:hypothetical protein